MIVFDLTCARSHHFEGWFASADDFERQSKAVLVRCPVCDDASVVRLPSAKVHIGRSGRYIAQSAIQLHGGMGMTDELAASHYAKRLTMVNAQLGDVEHHLDRFIQSGAPS